MLAKICQAVDIPVVAIGGLNKEHLELLKGTGVDGIAVVSALFAADDIEKAAEELKEAVKRFCKDENVVILSKKWHEKFMRKKLVKKASLKW